MASGQTAGCRPQLAGGTGQAEVPIRQSEQDIDAAPVIHSCVPETQAGAGETIDAATLNIATAPDKQPGVADTHSGERAFHDASLQSLEPAPDTHSAAAVTHSCEWVKNDV